MKLQGKTTQELVQMREAICADLKNQQSDSLFLYTKQARKKLEEIDRAIAQNLKDARIARGETIAESGYSGRQTNRR